MVVQFGRLIPSRFLVRDVFSFKATLHATLIIQDEGLAIMRKGKGRKEKTLSHSHENARRSRRSLEDASCTFRDLGVCSLHIIPSANVQVVTIDPVRL